MSVLRGTTVSLSCNTTILQSDNYRLPELKWRFNGQLLNGSHPTHFWIHTYSGNSRSELTIMGVSQRDSGYYECVALDGYHLLQGGEPAYIYTVASQRAQLKVIGKFDSDFNHTSGGRDQENSPLPSALHQPQKFEGVPNCDSVGSCLRKPPLCKFDQITLPKHMLHKWLTFA